MLIPSRIEAPVVPSEDLAAYSGMPIAQIIQDPLKRDHHWFRKEMDELLALCGDCVGEEEAKARRLAEHLRGLRALLILHFDTEELIVFPLVDAEQPMQAQSSLRTLETEHLDFARELERTRQITDDFELPEGASSLWKELVDRLGEYERRMALHTRIETELVFPHILYGSDRSEKE